jgi:uncharacterized protein (TIGR03437 family)
MVFNPRHPGMLFLLPSVGILRSSDGAESWQVVGAIRPTLMAYPGSLQFNLIPGAPASALLELRTLELSQTPFLRCTPSTIGGTDPYIDGSATTFSGVVVRTGGNLPAGVHERTIALSCPEAVNTPLRIPVHIVVVDPLSELNSPVISVLPQSGTQFTERPSGRAFAVDRTGNVYAVTRDDLIVKLTPNGETIVVAGSSTATLEADGVPATSVRVDPTALAVDLTGSVYFADHAQRIRKVTPDGIIHTVLTTEPIPFTDEHGPPVSTFINASGLAVDGSGNLYASARNRVVKITPAGERTTVAGGVPRGYSASLQDGFSGDGGSATAAELNVAAGIALDSAGNLYIADSGNHRVRRVSSDGIITTVAGNGRPGFGGDGGPAVSASLFEPNQVAVDSANNLYIIDSGNGRVRMVSPDGIILTLAGAGGTAGGWAIPGGWSECGPASLLRLSIFGNRGTISAAVAVDGEDSLYIADYAGGIYRVPSSAIISRSPPPRISPAGVVNAASYRADALSGGSIVSVFGTALATTTAGAHGTPLPRNLGGTFLCLDGRLAPLFFVSPHQVNAQLPFAGPSALLAAVSGGSSSPHISINVNLGPSPGIFQVEGNRAVAQNQDGTVNSPQNPAVVGTVAVIYFTGIGYISGAPIGEPAPDFPMPSSYPASATIGGVKAEILFVGITPGSIGLGQANIRVPGLPSGEHPVVLTIGGAQSNAALIAVRN